MRRRVGYNHKLSNYVPARENVYLMKYNGNHYCAPMHAILFPPWEKEKPTKGKRKNIF